MMENQTPADRLAVVESLLKDTYRWLTELKDERRNTVPLRVDEDFDVKTGKIRALSMVLDAFAEMGFDIDKEES